MQKIFYFLLSSLIFIFIGCDENSNPTTAPATMESTIETQNFKVDSKDWPQFEKNGIIYKVYNPQRNNDYIILEFVSGVADYLIGEQLFSYTAACAETEKTNKKMPTSYEWDTYLSKIFNKSLDEFGGLSDIDIQKITGLIKPGYISFSLNGSSNLDWNNLSLKDQYRGASYWSGNGSLSVMALDNNINRNNFRDEGTLYLLSVRCKK